MSTEQLVREKFHVRLLHLYDDLDYALRGLSEVERELTHGQGKDRPERQLASQVADAIVHLAEARAVLFRASHGL